MIKKKKYLDQNIMSYIVLCIKPLSLVEDENFMKIIKDSVFIKYVPNEKC